MSLGGGGGYGSMGPPVPSPNEVVQSPPQTFTEDTGVFTIKLTLPTWVQRGVTGRFKFYAAHVLDGVVQTFNPALAAGILDQYGSAVLASYVTMGAVTVDQGALGQYYSDIQFNTIMPGGNYLIEWTGSYTPKAGAPALPIRSRRAFKVIVPQAPSRMWFKNTANF